MAVSVEPWYFRAEPFYGPKGVAELYLYRDGLEDPECDLAEVCLKCQIYPDGEFFANYSYVVAWRGRRYSWITTLSLEEMFFMGAKCVSAVVNLVSDDDYGA